MLRGNFQRSFRNQHDRGRREGSSEFRRNDRPSRFSPRDNDRGEHYGPAERLDQRDHENSRRNFEYGRNSQFGSPSDIQGGRNPQMQLFPSPITPGSQQNPFSFAGLHGNTQMVSNPGDQNRENSGLPNFQFLAAPGQHSSIQNPFSATGMSSLQNFQMATPSVGYSGFSGTPQFGNFQNLANSNQAISNTTNLSEMSTTMSNLRNNVKIPPYAQIVSPGIRVQTNPYNFHASSSYDIRQQNTTVPNQFISQSANLVNPVNQAAVSDQQLTLMQNASFTPLSESQKVKLNVLNSRLRAADNELVNMQKGCFKRNYTKLRDISKYNSWRQQFLMQAQSDFHMHEIYDPTFVPACVKYPKPQYNDPEWEGRIELVNAAIELHNALNANYEWKLNFQGMAIAEAISENDTAHVFVKTGQVDARQILRDMDEAFIKRNPLTKGDFISNFFTLTKHQGELWSTFFPRVENMKIEGWNLFSYVFTDDDEFAVIQKNIIKDANSVEYSPTLYQMIQSNKSLLEIKKAIIGIETLARTRQAHAHSVRDFVQSKYDRQHNPMNSPQRDHWRYKHHGRGNSRSPSQGTRYGESGSSSGAGTSMSRIHGDRDRDRSPYRRRFDGFRDRSRSRSPYDKTGRRDPNSSAKPFNSNQYMADRSRHRSPMPPPRGRSRESLGRSRSPSPGSLQPARKHVEFRKPVAQNAVGDDGAGESGRGRDQAGDGGSRESPDDGVDPDLAGYQEAGDSDGGVAHLARSWSRVLGSSSLAMVAESDPVDQITDEQVEAHLQKYPGDGKLTGRGLRSLVYYQLTHPQFRSRVVQVVPIGRADAAATTPTTHQRLGTGIETVRSGVTQAEIDEHLAWYPDDEWLSRSQLELIVRRAKEENRLRAEDNCRQQSQIKLSRRQKRQ